VKAKRRKALSEQEAIKKLREQTTLWRWLQTGRINPKMAEWLESKLKEKKL
jgi:hypothetical protein